LLHSSVSSDQARRGQPLVNRKFAGINDVAVCNEILGVRALREMFSAIMFMVVTLSARQRMVSGWQTIARVHVDDIKLKVNQ
jgi:hypothetical protein